MFHVKQMFVSASVGTSSHVSRELKIRYASAIVGVLIHSRWLSEVLKIVVINVIDCALSLTLLG